LVFLISFFVLFRTTQAERSENHSNTRRTIYPSYQKYYVTRTLHSVEEVSSACAAGYHFASIWEIADPSALKYNHELGWSGPDSGGGPPSAIKLFGNTWPINGWVRTGYTTAITEPPGQANCSSWISSNPFHWGTVANLPSNWLAGQKDIDVWNVGVQTCDSLNFVWCVQDDSVWRTFMPLTIR
jgi:hypothetical protein